jgi:hypothetical protein
MARPLRPGSPITMPGVPDEEENKNKVPFAPVTDEEQTQGEQTLQQLASTPPAQPAAPQPEDAMVAYQRLSKEAEEATPSEQDVLAANLRRTGAQLRAEAPAYLEKATETLFHKPDYSQISRVAQAEAQQPDMILTAKEQAQKRLQILAEGARKRALLPVELKKQEAETSIAQARMDALKEAAALKAKANASASPEDIKKFNNTFGKIGASVPEDITKGELSELWKQTSDLAIKRGTEFGVAERAAASREAVAATKAEISADARKEGKEIKSKEELIKLTVPNIGVARTPEDAKELKTMSAAKKNIEGGLSQLQTQYKDLSQKDISSTPKILQNIGQEGKNLVMAYKEFFRLGAPQAAELNFLYSMVDSTPL